MDLAEINIERGRQDIRPKFRDEEYLKNDLSESVGTAVDLITSLCTKTLAFSV